MNIEKFCLDSGLGNVININKLTGGLMHKMFKVETDNGVYAIKVLNPEVMKRDTAYNNFIISETISNLAKSNNIPVSSALKINDEFIIKYDDTYFMVFDFIDGKVLTDEEITVEHCKMIGDILSRIHNLDYSSLGLDTTIKEDRFYVDWKAFIDNENFSKMDYGDLYLNNYQKYYSIMKRTVDRFNSSNTSLALCHRDMDPKNVMWSNSNPIVIDWESAQLSNPYRELIEDALCWSGFLSDNFNEEKFKAVIMEYAKNRDIAAIDWYEVICGNLVGRFGWLDYNLKRSLGLKTDEHEEMKLAENEVSKTIIEINRYLELIGTMYDICHNLSFKEENNYDGIIEKIICANEILNDEYQLITAGFTNTIYSVGDYIVRICTDLNNEDRFKKEVKFYETYKENKNIPKLYVCDITKSTVPYCYQIMEKINGKTLYEIWYKLNEDERRSIVIDIVNILKTFHNESTKEWDFATYIKNKINNLLNECNLDNSLFTTLLNKCDKLFEHNKFGLIHGDLHFDNFIYNNGKLILLDFERCFDAPIDYDFKIFNRYSKAPWLWASAKTDMLTVEDDYQNLMNLFIDNYEELKDIKYLNNRLQIYEIIDYLNDYKRTKDVNILQTIKEIIGNIQ